MAKNSTELLQEFVHLVRGAAGENLLSVVLYGSGARGDAQDAYSDVNLMCVLKSASRADLDRLASVVDWWSRGQKQRPPLVFTADELCRSADVFAIELLDMQNSRMVLFGEDIVASLPVPTNLHRVQVEHELRTMIQKLRQHYLHSAVDPETLRTVLAKSWSSSSTLLRHALIALGAEAPGSAADLIAQAGKLLKTDTAPLRTVMDLRAGGSTSGSIAQVYGDYLRVLEEVTEQIDRQLPKPEWRRVATGK